MAESFIMQLLTSEVFWLAAAISFAVLLPVFIVVGLLIATNV